MEDPATLPARHARIAWRDSSRATDSRTVRVALVPPNVVLVHQAYTLFWREGDARDEAYALGVLSSIPFDWFARQLVESHVTVEFMNSAPVPAREREDAMRRRVELIAGHMAAIDGRFNGWATRVGDFSELNGRSHADLEAELDAAVARLYGLTEDDVKIIFETFHVGWDYSTRLATVLEHFRRMA